MPHRFASTHWSLIAAARGQPTPAARQALADLCGRYWFPIYCYVRRSHSHADAEELTQSFFARLLEKDGFGTADPAKGRFRSFLLTACRNFLANDRDRRTAKKRGSGRVVLPFDLAAAEGRYRYEPADPRTPEQLFDRQWALDLLEQTLADLRSEYAAAGKAERFDLLKPALTGSDAIPVEQAASVGLNAGSLKVAVHRLRQKYRDRLRAAIAETVTDEAEIEDEIRALFSALAM